MFSDIIINAEELGIINEKCCRSLGLEIINLECDFSFCDFKMSIYVDDLAEIFSCIIKDKATLLCHTASSFPLVRIQPDRCMKIGIKILLERIPMVVIFLGCFNLNNQKKMLINSINMVDNSPKAFESGTFYLECIDSYGLNCEYKCPFFNENITCNNQGSPVCRNSTFRPPECNSFCDTQRCKNGGFCQSTTSYEKNAYEFTTQYSCGCRDFTSGRFCEIYTCFYSSCIYGSCVNGTCACENRYTGYDCSKNLCEEYNICGNRGICNTDPAILYKCKCLPEYTGDYCNRLSNSNEEDIVESKKNLDLLINLLDINVKNNKTKRRRTIEDDDSYNKKSNLNLEDHIIAHSDLSNTKRKFANMTQFFNSLNSYTDKIGVSVKNGTLYKRLLSLRNCNYRGFLNLNKSSNKYYCKCFNKFYGEKCENKCNSSCTQENCDVKHNPTTGDCREL